MREPVAEGFYPFDKEELNNLLDRLMSESKAKTCKNIQGAIVPHAGYAYSGPIAAHVFSSLPGYDTVIILGTNHTGVGERVAVSQEDWQTPLGIVRCDAKVAKDIVQSCEIAHFDDLAHMYEHSIEVQLPFLQKAIGDFTLVAISVSSDMNAKNYSILAKAIQKAAGKKNTLILASSDFTHFGAMYDFEPVKKDAVKWVEQTDKEIINAILASKIDDTLELSKTSTVCGYAPIAVLMGALENTKGRLLKYGTSYDISKNKDAIVGYAGIIFEK